MSSCVVEFKYLKMEFTYLKRNAKLVLVSDKTDIVLPIMAS